MGLSMAFASSSSAADDAATVPRTKVFAKALPEVWKLVKPRRWPLAGCLLLMIINRFCGFAVPISSRYLINNVMYRHEMTKLPLIIGAVAGATIVQGITTYILDRYLSITGQRLI